MGTPIGITTNNPGDLLSNINWAGTTTPYQSPNGLSYANFTTPQAGITALSKDLSTAIGEGFNTVSGLVYHYLGTSSNNAANPNVSNYLAAVVQATGLSPSSPITTADVPNLSYGIAVAEGTASGFPQLSANATSNDYATGTLGNFLEGIGVPNNFLIGSAGLASVVTGQPQQASIGGNTVSVTPAATTAAAAQASGITSALATFNNTLSAAFSANTWTTIAVVGVAIVLLIGALILLAKGPILETGAATGAA